jgi:hypothetical protein
MHRGAVDCDGGIRAAKLRAREIVSRWRGHGGIGGLSRAVRTDLAAQRACLAVVIHVTSGDQSVSVAHAPIVQEISYKVN